MKIDWSGRSHNYNKKDLNYITNAIKTADPLTQGQYLKKFELDFSKYIQKKNVFALSSAAAALEIIAAIMNFKKGDEVIVPAHTYCATVIPFARNGAKIIWADIDPDTRVIDLEDVKKKINRNTKAIIIVHLYGYAVDFSNLIFLAKKRKIKIIEDCAQALGAEVKGKKAGTLGDFSCFSFHAQKNITTLGEGGMLFVKNNKDAKKVRGLRHNGHCDYKKKSHYWLPAMTNLDLDVRNHWPYKYTLTETQCAAGIVMLKKLDYLNKIRINRAKKIIFKLKNFNELIFFERFKNRRHVYHLLTAYYKPSKKINRNDLIYLLYKKFKIKCAVQFYPLYKYPLFKKMGVKKISCKNTENFFNNMISFPFHVWMSKENFNYLINSIIKALLILQKKR